MFKLAGHLKWPSVAWGLARISSAELTEWRAFWRLEPFGDDWRQTGTVAAVSANPYRTDGRAPFTAADFMPSAPEDLDPPEPQTSSGQIALCHMIAAAYAASLPPDTTPAPS